MPSLVEELRLARKALEENTEQMRALKMAIDELAGKSPARDDSVELDLDWDEITHPELNLTEEQILALEEAQARNRR